MLGSAKAIGIDLGTSGVRAAALNERGEVLASTKAPYRSLEKIRDAGAWWTGVKECLTHLRLLCSFDDVLGVAVDGTSGTVVAVDSDNRPVGLPSLYNDVCDDGKVLSALNAIAPRDSAARGITTPLGRAIVLSRRLGVSAVVHQADWIAMLLGEGTPIGDENNALKTGYSLEDEIWPEWLEDVGMRRSMLPQIVRAGEIISPVGRAARDLGLPASAKIHAGTTDGCASFLATGAKGVGEAVTALGSTLVLKIACDRPISVPEFGVYSHRVGNLWLAGGASNTGGAVITSLVSESRLDELSGRMDPTSSTGLHYYPLLKPGERFPINDPYHLPKIEPRPSDDAVYLQAIFEGIAAIECMGYQRLSSLGGPSLKNIRTVGGGAKNMVWRTIRQQNLGVPLLAPDSDEAATGVARLVLRNWIN
ncbi:FGGY-family carbohydrate kinase (plasmid) [Phyllobacterium sp. 628]|nr:FGGY-family carbohydrate kinase [Phyllobacterium sp. 628]QND55181.1 FGGY-family carbohydrate kinase [Phyllobacterium sp. 628]